MLQIQRLTKIVKLKNAMIEVEEEKVVAAEKEKNSVDQIRQSSKEKKETDETEISNEFADVEHFRHKLKKQIRSTIDFQLSTHDDQQKKSEEVMRDDDRQGVIGHFDEDSMIDRAVTILFDGQNERDHRCRFRRVEISFDENGEGLLVEPTI